MNDAMTTVIESITWGCNPFWSDCIVFNQSIITMVIAALMLTLSANGPLKVNVNHIYPSLIKILTYPNDAYITFNYINLYVRKIVTNVIY